MIHFQVQYSSILKNGLRRQLWVGNAALPHRRQANTRVDILVKEQEVFPRG